MRIKKAGPSEGADTDTPPPRAVKRCKQPRYTSTATEASDPAKSRGGKSRTRSADPMAIRSRTIAARFRHPDLERSYIIPVLSKALQIIALLEATQAPLNVTQVSNRTGFSKSTVYRILRTLSAHGYVQESGKDH